MTDDKLMGTEKITPLMWRLAVPSIIAQLINILYNMVDRMYIGRIPQVGSLALTALGVAFPVIMIISAFSAFAGAGGAPLAAMQLGKGNSKEAERILGNAFTLLIAMTVVLTAVFLIFQRPILFLFGASENTIGFATDYVTIYVAGTIFVQLALGLNMFISSQGNAKTAMFSVLIGAVLNTILDPIFIFGFKMGVKGAAVATVISQAVSALWVVAFLCSKKSAIQIRLRYLKPNMRIIAGIGALGISPFIMRATESLIAVTFNSSLQFYGGDLFVGSMTISQTIMQLMVVPIQGFTMGVQPILSYNFGAHQLTRVRETCKKMFAITISAACIFTLIVILFPGTFAFLLTNDADLIDLVKQVLPIYFAGMWMFGIQMSVQTVFIGLGESKKSLFIAILRKIILLIPLTLVLPRFFGVMGIYYAEPVSDILAAAVSGLIFVGYYRKTLKKDTLSE